ncbi:hypothetical protein A5N78_01775 [Prescottella equi]|uniref:hypothetical protein n=1 Tax=Rhodococcus hoagii TaxID=43767 RepID=UPI000A0FA259|nr:hypothetical protein [Prescottella equi]ORL92943.1 hypothetical protein A5N78_01775 [Prescottella equi]ORM20619.1 hypothetical protein A5N70_05935 [Prescottella equi]
MSNGRSKRGMGQYLAKPIERDENGNAKNPGVALTEAAGKSAEQRALEFQRAKGLPHSGPRRGMGYYLEREE